MYTVNQIDNIYRALALNGSNNPTITAVKNVLHEISDNGMEGGSFMSDADIGIGVHGNCLDIEELDFEHGYSVSIGRVRVFTDTDEENIRRYLELAKLFAKQEEHPYIDHLIELMN
jgi:hypothetical protein